MRVYSKDGSLAAESPLREPLASTPLVTTALQIDAANLAPVALELEAVRLYSQTGSLAAVSRQLGVAIYELQKLQRTEWWQAELAALRREEQAIKNARLSRIHQLTLDALEDRVTHGDFVMKGNGFVRVKMSGKDLARVSEAVFKQRQLLLGEPTSIDGSNKKLEELSQKLRALGAKDASHLTIDVEARNVPHQEGDRSAYSDRTAEAGQVASVSLMERAEQARAHALAGGDVE